jgi:hypothetical protein
MVRSGQFPSPPRSRRLFHDWTNTVQGIYPGSVSAKDIRDIFNVLFPPRYEAREKSNFRHKYQPPRPQCIESLICGLHPRGEHDFPTIMADNTQPVQLVEKEGASDAMHQEHKEGLNEGVKEGIKVETVQGSVALDIARRTDPPNPWSAQMRKLYLFMTVAYLCSALNGTRQRQLGS